MDVSKINDEYQQLMYYMFMAENYIGLYIDDNLKKGKSPISKEQINEINKSMEELNNKINNFKTNINLLDSIQCEINSDNPYISGFIQFAAKQQFDTWLQDVYYGLSSQMLDAVTFDSVFKRKIRSVNHMI